MSTGGRVFPSITGGGLSRAGEAIFNAVLAKKQRELQERQIDRQDRADALNRFTTLSGFLEPGTTLGDLGQSGRDMFETAFLMSAEGLDDLVLSPETLQTVLDERARGFVDDNPDITRPAIRSILGLEPSENVAAMRDLEAQLQFDALTAVTEDPVLKSEFVSRALGREPITLTIPGFGGQPDRQISFASPTAANIYAEFLLARERFSLQLDLQNEEASNALIEEIQRAVNESGQNISSTALSGRVLPTYNRAVSSGDLSIITRYLDSAGTSEGERLAMQYLLGSIRAGEETYIDEVRRVFPQVANFLEFSGAVKELIPTAEMAAELLPGMTQAAFSSGLDIPILRDPLFGGLRLEISGPAPDETIQTGSSAFGQVPRDTLIQAARNILDEGSISREELIEIAGEDIVNAAVRRQTRENGDPAAAPAPEAPPEIPDGGFDPAQVPESVRGDARTLNTLLKRQEEGRSGLQSRNLAAQIKMRQDRIRAAMLEPAVQEALDAVTLTEAEEGFPAGGIKPESVPEEARSEVRQLNTLLKRIAGGLRGRALQTAEQRVNVLRRQILEKIAAAGVG